MPEVIPSSSVDIQLSGTPVKNDNASPHKASPSLVSVSFEEGSQGKSNGESSPSAMDSSPGPSGRPHSSDDHHLSFPIDPIIERQATMLMMDVIDRDPDCYFLDAEGKLESVWTDTEFGMEVGNFFRSRRTTHLMGACAILQWLLNFFQTPCPRWVTDNNAEGWFLAIDMITLVPLWLCCILKLYCTWDKRSRWFSGKTMAREMPWLCALTFFLTIHTLMYFIFPFTKSSVTTIYGRLELNSLVWVSITCRGFFLAYFFHPVKKIAPNVCLVFQQLGPLALFAFSSYLVHYFVLNAVASGIAEEAETWGIGGDVAVPKGLWNLYIAMTTANHPDVVMPLYHSKPAAYMVMMSFMAFNGILLMNLCLAIVADEYGKLSRQIFAHDAELRAVMLQEAFTFVSHQAPGKVHREVEHDIIDRILGTVNKVKKIQEKGDVPPATANKLPGAVETDVGWPRLITDLVELDGDATLSRHEFCQIVAFCHAPLRVKDYSDPLVQHTAKIKELKKQLAEAQASNDFSLTWNCQEDLRVVESMSPGMHGATFPFLYWLVEDFSLFDSYWSSFNGIATVMTLALILHAVLEEWDPPHSRTGSAMSMNFGFATVFTFEILIKTVAGARPGKIFRYLYKKRAWLDMVATGAMWVTLYHACTAPTGCWNNPAHEDGTSDTFKPIAIVARIARASRVVTMAQRFPRLRVLSRSFTRMLPVIAPHGGMFLVMYTVFLGAGMGMFASVTTRVVEEGGPGNWTTSPWKDSHYGKQPYYYDLNFDNGYSGFVLLFVVMIQNNWHIVAEGIEMGSGSRESRFFFFLYNITVQVVTMNIFISVIITVLSLFREDELAKYYGVAGEDLKSNAFANEVTRRLKLANGPSGIPYDELWEVSDQQDAEMEEQAIDEEYVLGRDEDELHYQTMSGLLNVITVPMFGRTIDGYLCYTNEAFVELINAGAKEAYNHGSGSVIETHSRDYFTEAMEKTLEQCHGTTGSFIWLDDKALSLTPHPYPETHREESTLRFGSGNCWSVEHAPYNWHPGEGMRAGGILPAGLRSCEQPHQLGMLFWLKEISKREEGPVQGASKRLQRSVCSESSAGSVEGAGSILGSGGEYDYPKTAGAEGDMIDLKVPMRPSQLPQGGGLCGVRRGDTHTDSMTDGWAFGQCGSRY